MPTMIPRVRHPSPLFGDIALEPSLWMQDAACRDADPSLFFADDREPLYPSEETLKFCNNCIVRFECLQDAIIHGWNGVWGGTTDYQRDQLRRRRQRTSCPVCRGSLIVPDRRQHEICLGCGASWKLPGQSIEELQERT